MKTNHPDRLRMRSGYLLEIPLIMVGVLIGLAVLLPHIPAIAGKFLVIPAVLIMIGGVFYMIVIPGWQPGNPRRLPYPWNFIVFFVVALIMLCASVAFIFYR